MRMTSQILLSEESREKFIHRKVIPGLFLLVEADFALTLLCLSYHAIRSCRIKVGDLSIENVTLFLYLIHFMQKVLYQLCGGGGGGGRARGHENMKNCCQKMLIKVSDVTKCSVDSLLLKLPFQFLT